MAMVYEAGWLRPKSPQTPGAQQDNVTTSVEKIFLGSGSQLGRVLRCAAPLRD
jgi:hypothetical protein